MNNIDLKIIFKRIIAYMIDIILITIIASALTYLPIFNKSYNKYSKMYTEFSEIYEEFTSTKVLLNDSYTDSEISEEEYNKLYEIKTYSSIFKEKYSDEIITKDEYNEINDYIDTSMNSISEEYSYKLQKLGITNSIITLVCTLLYFGIIQYFLKGQSIGKKILNLKIVSANNKKITILNYLIRSLIVNNVLLNGINIIFLAYTSKTIFYKATDIISLLVSVVEAVIIFLIITREDNRGLHDLICNTKVISTKE